MNVAGQLCVALGYPDFTEIKPDRWPVLRSDFVTKSPSYPAQMNWGAEVCFGRLLDSPKCHLFTCRA